MLTFVGGVRDAGGARGFVPIAPDTIVAVDLAAGAVLWRRGRIGRPLAATATRLVTLVVDGATYGLRLFDTASGEDAGRVEQLGLPDWADAGTSPDVVHVDTSETADGLRVDWRLRRPYRGGAPPPAEVLDESTREAAGRLLLNLDTAKAVVTDAPSVPRDVEAPPDALPVTTDPSVVAAARVSNRVFALKAMAQGQTTVVVLEARDAYSGVLQWQAILAEQASGGAAPLRK